MNEKMWIPQENAVRQCKKISNLMEQEEVELNRVLRGDVFEAYQQFLHQDMALVSDIRNKLKKLGGKK